MKTLPVLLVALCTGCASVPATHISFNPATKALEIKSPKDVKFSGFKAIIDGQKVTVQIDRYASDNNPEVLNSVSAANAATLEKAVGVIGSLTETLTESGVAGLKKGIVP